MAFGDVGFQSGIVVARELFLLRFLAFFACFCSYFNTNFLLASSSWIGPALIVLVRKSTILASESKSENGMSKCHNYACTLPFV